LSTSGNDNTVVGATAMGNAIATGSANVVIGSGSGTNIVAGSSNTLIGTDAGNGLGAGTQNICIGRAANTPLGASVNELVLGSATYYVATNGGPTTYFAAGAAGGVAVPVTCSGFIRIYLNGTYVKIPVYPN
jgi:hypothetical protein